MSVRTPLCIAAALLGLVSVSGCVQAKYTPKANEEIFGDWTNNDMPQPRAVISAEAFKHYISMDGDEIMYAGTMEIAAKWRDSNGDLYYKTLETVTSGLGGLKGTKWQALHRLSSSGAILESISFVVGEFSSKGFPTKFDKKDDTYRLYYRSQK